MSLLYRIIYATHAKGTHHKLALDALGFLAAPDAEAWRRLFLKHAEPYLTASKAPDDEFKDFKNHVLHPRDGFWGGAAEKAESWYGDLVAALAAEKWPDAVWAAGVLSHYYTDPLMPFHTGQSEAESNIHRAAEWSISRAYDSLWADATAAAPPPLIALPEGRSWLGDLVRANAVASNRHYEKLMAHYDIGRGVSDPPAGLDRVSRRLIGELLVTAAAGFGAVLDRAIAEAAVAPPEVTLTVETVLATLKIPVKVLAKRLADAEERRLVTAMYDELMATGTVEANLPADDRAVRDLHAAEVARPKAQVSQPPPPAKPAALHAPAESRVPSAGKAHERHRARLAASDDLEHAPSIGPKTAERFAALGIRTVADFLAADAAETAAQLATAHIRADTVSAWQAQARLVMAIPGLAGTHAQLLTGAGYRSAEAIAMAEPAALCAAVLAFAGTHDGQRILRDGHAPDIEKIRRWIDGAATARAA